MTRKKLTSVVYKCAAVFAALFVCGAATAEDVTVTSKNGQIAVTGRVIGYDGEFLQVESQYGPLTLEYAQVRCDGLACPDRENYIPILRMSGSARITSVLMPALIEGFARAQQSRVQYEEATPNHIKMSLQSDAGTVARFELHGATAEEGFADLTAYSADIVLATREVRDIEILRGREAGVGALDAAGQSRVVGLDALVPIVSPSQPVTAISLVNLTAAFAGAVDNWSALGGSDDPIALHLGPRNDGRIQSFLDQLSGVPHPDITYHETMDGMATAVAVDRNAIGIASFTDTGIAQPMTLRDDCGFIAVPRLTTLKAEDYPLTLPLFIYLPEWRLHPVARDLLAFLRTPAAHLIVRRAGFVDQGAVPIPLDAQGQRFVSAIAEAGPEVTLDELQRMVRAFAGLARASVSFRFEAGSTRLDAGSRSNLLLLAHAVRDGDYDGRTLWLMGFSDGRGSAKENRKLSAARAEAVRRDLAELLSDISVDVTLKTEAFGEALPMGCDDTKWGRQMNRRVELWVSE